MPKLSGTPYTRHIARWKDCKECDLCEERKNVVLLRGRIPASILFIGEAPGESEDVSGSPFDGPAGHLFDTILINAGIGERDPKTLIVKGDFAMSNLIGCIPRDENGEKTSKPPKYAIDACSARLRECFSLVKPKLIVWVGEEAKKHGPKALLSEESFNLNPLTVHVIHPGAIIRGLDNQRGLAIQTCTVRLQDAYELIR